MAKNNGKVPCSREAASGFTPQKWGVLKRIVVAFIREHRKEGSQYIQIYISGLYKEIQGRSLGVRPGDVLERLFFEQVIDRIPKRGGLTVAVWEDLDESVAKVAKSRWNKAFDSETIERAEQSKARRATKETKKSLPKNAAGPQEGEVLINLADVSRSLGWKYNVAYRIFQQNKDIIDHEISSGNRIRVTVSSIETLRAIKEREDTEPKGRESRVAKLEIELSELKQMLRTLLDRS